MTKMTKTIKVRGVIAVLALVAMSGCHHDTNEQANAAALRIVAIGAMLAATIVLRPRGIFGERATVSRHLDNSSAPQAVPRR